MKYQKAKEMIDRGLRGVWNKKRENIEQNKNNGER